MNHRKKFSNLGGILAILLVASSMTLGAVTSANAADAKLSPGASGVTNTDSSSESNLPIRIDNSAIRPLLDTVIVLNQDQGNSFAITGLSDGVVAESQGGEPQEFVVLSADGGPYGQLTAPFAMDANGVKIPSTYTVAGDTVTQEFTVTASTVYPITLAPAYLRDGHSEDAEVSANYHQMLLNIPGDNAGDGGPQLRLAGVSIPSNYIKQSEDEPKRAS